MSDDPGGWQRYNIDRAIAYSIEAIKASLLINGAAAIALMAFLGAVAAPDSRISIDVHEIKYALITFGTGSRDLPFRVFGPVVFRRVCRKRQLPLASRNV
jgi:hypothetical protein